MFDFGSFGVSPAGAMVDCGGRTGPGLAGAGRTGPPGVFIVFLLNQWVTAVLVY